MKKFVLVISLLLILGMLTLPVLAAQTASVSLSASDTTVSPGDTVVITVSATKMENCVSGGFMFSYDKEVFEYVEGSALVSGYASAGVSTLAGNLSGFFMSGNSTVDGAVFQIKLMVKDTAALGSYTISGTPSFKTEEGDVSSSVSGVKITVGCDHVYGEYTKVDESKHQRVCTKCGETDAENHSWDNGTTSVAPSCSAPGQKTYKCRLCNATKTESLAQTAHTYDNPCDTSCNICGAYRSTYHNYPNTWTSDRTGHWHACTGCGAKNQFAAHVPGPAATSTTPQVCTICNYQLASASGHQHTMDPEWVGDENEHWHRCTQSCSYTEDRETHEYDSGCDVDCNICGYIRTAPHKYRQEWQADINGHWQCCIDCFALSDPVPHVPGPEATETEPQRCLECGFVIAMELSHDHDFTGPWYCDSINHWQACTNEHCFETANTAPHVWDDGTVQDNGDTVYLCTTCGKQRVITGTSNPPETEPTQPATEPTTGTAKKDKNKSDSFPWEWAGLAAIALLVIGIVLLVIEFIRSRKSNHHGRYSK